MRSSNANDNTPLAPQEDSNNKPSEWSPADRRVQVAAARLRTTLDERLGRDTPPSVKALAKQDL